MRTCTLFFVVCQLTFAVADASARSRSRGSEPAPIETPEYVDMIGDVDGSIPRSHKVAQDTVWIADWTFESGAACDDSGWERIDNYVRNDGKVYWNVVSDFDGVGGIVGNAAALGDDSPESCCATAGGYANNWYQAMRIEYTGAATFAFDYLLDGEPGFDFMQIEVDEGCASFDRVDYNLAPGKKAASFRQIISRADTLDLSGHFEATLPDFGSSDTHCVYVSFLSDGVISGCDLVPDKFLPTINKPIVVDNVQFGGQSEWSEDFESTLDPRVTFVNLRDVEPLGEWGRTYEHITDSDICTENTSCAWLWSDHTTPTIANDPSTAFAPSSYVIRNWLDNSIVSPWVSLSSAPNAVGTVLQFRRFGGNLFANSRIVQGDAVRGKTPRPNSACEDVTNWSVRNNSLSSFAWQTSTKNLTPRIDGAFAFSTAELDPQTSQIQVRFRTFDWQLEGASPPTNFVPGPGPFLDRVRIGRVVLSGPAFDTTRDVSSQAQDGFPTEINPGIPGQHFRPTTDRFGTTAFSRSFDSSRGPNVVLGDSILVSVFDARDAGGIESIEWYGAIVDGPHASKAPPPWTVGANGFFVVVPDTAREANGTAFPGLFFMDLDDFYFRGGDVLQYFWFATDAMGGASSNPAGLSSPPASIADAQASTGGMFEVSFLPEIDWDPTYLARIAADEHGDVEPTAAELANSSQRNCILYMQSVNRRRRSGDVNRTTFMYTLDKLGYRGKYDVYDKMDIGLGARATIEQLQGYSLVIHDGGNNLGGSISDSSAKVDQATWFRNWLAQAAFGEAQRATLWVLGMNELQSKPNEPLFNIDMGVALNSPDQGLNANPDVEGQTTFTFENEVGQTSVDFAAGPRSSFSLQGGCPVVRDYDGLGATGSAVEVYRYVDPVTGGLGDAAIVMNSNASGNWNTIMQSHAWFDIRHPFGGSPESPLPQDDLLATILAAALPLECQSSPDPTDVRRDATIATPRRTVLHRNIPNPFNPTTTISFDLARDGHVRLRIYDVAGRLVRTLVDETRTAGFDHRAVWDGASDAGTRVSSGVYFYRLAADDYVKTRKMLVMR